MAARYGEVYRAGCAIRKDREQTRWTSHQAVTGSTAPAVTDRVVAGSKTVPNGNVRPRASGRAGLAGDNPGGS